VYFLSLVLQLPQELGADLKVSNLGTAMAYNKSFKFVPAYGLHRTQLRCAA
jgi:hypothetical protein